MWSRGNVIAADMSEDFDVTVVDLNPAALEALKKKFPAVKTVTASATAPKRSRDPRRCGRRHCGGSRPLRICHDARCHRSRIQSDATFPSCLRISRSFPRRGEAQGRYCSARHGCCAGHVQFSHGAWCGAFGRSGAGFIYVGGHSQDPKPPFNYQVTCPQETLSKNSRVCPLC
jgi:hypothetical protein